jgi:alanine racemase
MAVVKADAYGHGAAAVARAALAHGASWLGVYTVDEGASLRESGIDAPILVFGPFEAAEAAQIVRNRLTPTVYTVEAGRILETSGPATPIPFHLKVDTGLSRSGVDPARSREVLDALAAMPALRPEGIYTHFARSDEPSRPETAQQLGLFLDTVWRLEQAGYTFEIKHAANTGATLWAADSHLDMVRFGIGTYGYAPSTDTQGNVALTPALSLLSSLVRVHTVSAGAGIGYGHEFVSGRKSRLALVPIGYGDGLPRSLGHSAGRVLVRGREAPILGRVSMDQIIIDVTNIPGASVNDDAVLIGRSETMEQDADIFAAQAGTISYDVLTKLLPRVPRLYSWKSQLFTPSEEVLDPDG